MAEFEELLQKIRTKADQYHESGQNELWAEAEEDFEKYQNWHGAGEKGTCPVDLSRYTSETVVAKKVEAPVIETTETATVVQEVVEPRRDNVRIQRLITDALTSVGREAYDEAERLVQEALELDPSSQEARATLQQIQKAQSEQVRKNLIYTLKYVSDIGPLKIALDNAENVLVKNPNDDEIAELRTQAKERFDALRKAQGQTTTSESFEDYNAVVEGIIQVKESRDRGDKTFYVERLKTIMGIDEVFKDFTTRLGPLASVFVGKKLDHVDSFLPKSGMRNPKSALAVLKECLEVEGLEKNIRDEIDSRIKSVTDEVSRWEKAEKELLKAENPEISDFERFQFFLSAKAVYPQHSDVIEKEHNFAENASIYIIEVIENSIAKYENLLAREASASLDQRISGHGDKPLPLFDDARNDIQELLIKANRIPEEHAAKNLKKAKEKANTFLTKLEKVENRRKEIRSTYLRITDETKRNPQTAISTLEGLDSSILEDPEIKYLRKVLDLNLDADGHIKIAKKHFESRKYKDCIDELNQIKDPGASADEIIKLSENADLRLTQEQILESWGKKFFDDGFEKIKHILRGKFINTELVTELIQDSKLNEKVADYQKRLEVDENNRILEQKTELRKEWEQIQAISLNDHNLLDWVERSIKLLQGVLEVSRLPSTQEGKWIVWANEIKAAIHDKSFAILNSIGKTENREQISSLFRIITRLQQYLLVITQDDRICRRDICLAYFSAIQKDLERSENWSEIVRNWEEAYTEFGEPAFWEKLHSSRFEAVKYVITSALRKFDYEKAFTMAKGQDLPFTFDPQSPTPFSSEEDRILDKLAQQGELMRKAHDLFLQKDFITMSDTLQAGIKGDEPKVLADYKRDLIGKAVKELSDKGDSVVQDNFAEGVLCFSTILRLDPENVLARGRIDGYRDNVYAEIKRVRIETDEIDPTADIDIQLKQNHDRGLTLQSLMASLDFLDSRNTPDKKFLKQASEENAQTRTALENAKKIIDEMSDENKVWQGIIRRGDWGQAQTKINDLKEIIGEHPNARLLENRLRAATETRRNRSESKKVLQDTYMNDRFDDFMTNYQALVTELCRETPGRTIPFDQYWIFPEGYTFFDDMIKKDIPFFHSVGEETCVECVIKQRIPNYKLFEEYSNKVSKECSTLKASLDSLVNKPASYDTLLKCTSLVSLCESTWNDLGFLRPSEDPLSKLAKNKLIGAEKEISDCKAVEVTVRENIDVLTKQHKDFQAEMANIINLVNMHQFNEAQQKLIPIRDFYIEGENDYRQFIEQTLKVCSYTPEPKKSIFGR